MNASEQDQQDQLSDWGSVGMGARIRAARIAKRWTQKDLAAKVGTSRHYLSAIENGKEASFAMYRRLAGALEIYPDDLFRGTSIGSMIGGSFVKPLDPETAAITGQVVRAQQLAFSIDWIVYSWNKTLPDAERMALHEASGELKTAAEDLLNVNVAPDAGLTAGDIHRRMRSALLTAQPLVTGAVRKYGRFSEGLPLHPNVWRYTSGHVLDTSGAMPKQLLNVDASYIDGKPLEFKAGATLAPWFFEIPARLMEHSIVIQVMDFSLKEMGIGLGDVLVTIPAVHHPTTTESAVVVELIPPGLVAADKASADHRPAGAAYIGRLSLDDYGDWEIARGGDDRVSLRGLHFRDALHVVAVVSSQGALSTWTDNPLPYIQ
jgi:transcriptional regulator with XRE-family HTH domain